jgi:hypothetical protein
MIEKKKSNKQTLSSACAALVRLFSSSRCQSDEDLRASAISVTAGE